MNVVDKLIEKTIQTNNPTVIGGDTAGDGEDFFTAMVVDQRGFLCAVLHNQFDEDLYAKQVYCLGVYYHSLIAIESNFSTFPNMELQRLRYPSLYVREQYDRINRGALPKFGFRTTVLTRPIIIDQLVVVVRENIENIQDRETLQEMLSFVRIKGKAQASDGTHDDLVMGLAIAYEALKQIPRSIGLPEQTRKEPEKNEELDFFQFGM